GIMPVRSLRIIFSATSPCSSIFAASNAASVRPPALPRSLWQPAQYCFTSWFCASTASPAGVAVDFVDDGVGLCAIDAGRVDGCEAAGFGAASGACAPGDVEACSAAGPTLKTAAAATATASFFMLFCPDSGSCGAVRSASQSIGPDGP